MPRALGIETPYEMQALWHGEISQTLGKACFNILSGGFYLDESLIFVIS